MREGGGLGRIWCARALAIGQNRTIVSSERHFKNRGRRLRNSGGGEAVLHRQANERGRWCTRSIGKFCSRSSEGTATGKVQSVRRGVVRESRQRVGIAVHRIGRLPIHVLFYGLGISSRSTLLPAVSLKKVCVIPNSRVLSDMYYLHRQSALVLRVLHEERNETKKNEPDGNPGAPRRVARPRGANTSRNFPRPFATRSIKARLKTRNRTGLDFIAPSIGKTDRWISDRCCCFIWSTLDVRGEKETLENSFKCRMFVVLGVHVSFPSRTHEWIFGETMVSV